MKKKNFIIRNLIYIHQGGREDRCVVVNFYLPTSFHDDHVIFQFDLSA